MRLADIGALDVEEYQGDNVACAREEGEDVWG